MYQAGIRNITLYETPEITFRHYDPLNRRYITALEGKGKVIQVLNNQRPEFEIKSKFSKSGQVVSDYKLNFLMLGFNLENDELISQIISYINGWCVLLELYDGTYKYYNTPLICRENEIKPQDEMSYKLTLETVVPAKESYYEYTPGISLNPVYRFDSTLISFDTEIYTFDYEL